MRETRPSGSEGGVKFNPSSLPLSRPQNPRRKPKLRKIVIRNTRKRRKRERHWTRRSLGQEDSAFFLAARLRLPQHNACHRIGLNDETETFAVLGNRERLVAAGQSRLLDVTEPLLGQ